MPGHERTDDRVVVGGTGKTGRRVAERLTARGLPVRIGARTSATPGVRLGRPLRRGRPRCGGAASAYVTFYPDLAVAGSTETIGAFAGWSRVRGVRRLVLLSGRGEAEAERAEQELAPPAPNGPWCAAAGSPRTSARRTSSTPWSPVSSPCPAEKIASRSSTPRTSPTWPRGADRGRPSGQVYSSPGSAPFARGGGGRDHRAPGRTISYTPDQRRGVHGRAGRAGGPGGRRRSRC